MSDLHEILRPSWGSEHWIQEGWDRISAEEKKEIQCRVDRLFKDGLPLELKHNKLFYIYTFSLLAQLEVLAIQVPLKFESKMPTPEFRELMHQQLLDEVFHGIVFTKILFLLCAPHALPPIYNKDVEILCNFIRNEDCPKMALMLLNLVGEGWIEEIFYSLEKYDVAPKVFRTIIDDEHRHVGEADLYRTIGLPDKEVAYQKLAFLENQMLTNIFIQYKNMLSISTLLGIEGAIDFTRSLHAKHQQQLQKIGLQPSDNWQLFMKFAEEIASRVHQYEDMITEVELTPIRQVFMTQWNNPSDPTMTGHFNIDITPIDFFNKKFPPETVTFLMLQTISLSLVENPSFRYFLSHHKLYQSKEAYSGLIAKLPGCDDHLATIVYENCHLTSIPVLAKRTQMILQMMGYCYQKRAYLEKQYPHLKAIVSDVLYQFANDVYPYPLAGNAVVSLSNIGFCGYTQSKSPLRSTEAMKVTLTQVERKPVWNAAIQDFEPRDLLPVSLSADHRILDGNIPVPRLAQRYFDSLLAKLVKDLQQGESSEMPQAQEDSAHLVAVIDQLIAANLESAYKLLLFLQTYWLDFWSLETIMQEVSTEAAFA